MSEEKLYVIKSRSGDQFYFSGDRMIPNWSDNLVRLFGSYEVAKEIAEDNNGQPVTFVEEEPEKVVLSKEQVEIIERARNEEFPATYISDSNEEDEELLMNAYINGYTVEKEKKYGVWVPHVNKMYYKDGSGSDGLNIASADFLNDKNQQFTETEIEHYGLQDCKKEEVKMNE